MNEWTNERTESKAKMINDIVRASKRSNALKKHVKRHEMSHWDSEAKRTRKENTFPSVTNFELSSHSNSRVNMCFCMCILTYANVLSCHHSRFIFSALIFTRVSTFFFPQLLTNTSHTRSSIFFMTRHFKQMRRLFTKNFLSVSPKSYSTGYKRA